MTKLKEFFNEVSKDNRIFTAEDVGEMPIDEFRNNRDAIFHQMANLGVPRRYQLAGNDDVIYVHAYTRADGTQVKAHYRSKHGNLTGAAAGTNNQTYSTDPFLKGGIEYNDIQKQNDINSSIIDNVIESSMDNGFMQEVLPIAAQNLRNSMHDFESAYNNEKATIVNRSDFKNQELNNIFDMLGIDKNSKGVFYGFDSPESEQLSKSKDLEQYIKENFDNLKSGNILEGSFEFKKGVGISDLDNFAGIKKVTLFHPKIDENGYFTALLLDKYDFDKISGWSPVAIVNNWGYKQQEKGTLENYFNMYFVIKKVH